MHYARAIGSLVESVVFLLFLPELYIALAQRYPEILLNSAAGLAYTTVFFGLMFLPLNFTAQLLGDERFAGLLLKSLSIAVLSAYFLVSFNRKFTIVPLASYTLSVSMYPVALVLSVLALSRIIPAAVFYLESRKIRLRTVQNNA
ncbi:MAG: hypothetical protein KIY12_02210 [Thermoplasmata archaeon]|uniref:Uncharacterized protein n=1 Tax=Candidatus Sysuiplasma superficiale TaxID=2823368 RepID=A0A8J7YQW1_9ARCH|nr:hypothetical protein [Candidatus Sysuiplasma superficiale]MBX8643531.1 hypothetical protein [Candidatus Sysuiplasma superficiale]